MSLPRSCTHPTITPLSSLSFSPPPAPRARSTFNTPLPTPLPRYDDDDPFNCTDFFALPRREGSEWSWVRVEGAENAADAVSVGAASGSGLDDQLVLEGEEEGLDACAEKMIQTEDRMGVLAISTTRILSPSRAFTSLPSPPPLSPSVHSSVSSFDDDAPQTDELLHSAFAARSRAVSYPDLVALAGGSQGNVNQKPLPKTRSLRVIAGKQRKTEDKLGQVEDRNANLGLFFDPPEMAPPGMDTPEGWRMWCLSQAVKLVGLE